MNPALQVDGIDILVEGDGPNTLVMVHGWPDNHRLWDAQVDHFRASHRCVRFTLPGFDLHQPRRAASLAELVALIRGVVEATSDGRPVTLMLHDWGCVFGYQFAMLHPAMVSRIVGVDIGDAGSPDHQRSMSLRAKAMVFGYQAWLAVAWRISGFGRSGGLGRSGGFGGHWPALADRMTRRMAKALRAPAEPALVGAQMNYPYDIEWTGSHGSYRGRVPFNPACPMLYIFGQRKPFQFHSRAWADALAARPGSRVLPFATGHWVMKQQPQAFNTAVADWLAASH